MGRPSKLTDELAREMLEMLEEGAFVSSACAAVGISRSTWASWRERGRLGEEPFAAFVEAVAAAEARAESTISQRIWDQAIYRGDLKAATWWLRHRFPSHWSGKPHADELAEPAGLVLDPETVAALREAADLVQAIGADRLSALAALGPDRLDALIGPPSLRVAHSA
jgi:Helix-turn-helix domain of resolvase